MCKDIYNNILILGNMALQDITYKNTRCLLRSTVILSSFKYTLKSIYKYNKNKAKLIFVTIAQYWYIFLTTNINKSNT